MRFALSPQRDRGCASAPRRAVIDAAQRLPGRGAYVCARTGIDRGPEGECMRRALARGGLSRTLRTAVIVDPELIESAGT